jgi:hypothetical protein
VQMAHKFGFPDLENALGFIADYEKAGSDPADSFEQVLLVKEEDALHPDIDARAEEQADIDEAVNELLQQEAQ